LGLDTVGGIFGGIQQGKMSAAEIAERQREFDKAFGLQSGGAAISAQHSLESAPMRDRVMAKLQALLSQTPGQFKPHDVFNGGGVAQQADTTTRNSKPRTRAISPGDGGVNTQVIRKFLASLGYGAPLRRQRRTTAPARSRRG
jgi:hypothetical protein